MEHLIDRNDREYSEILSLNDEILDSLNHGLVHSETGKDISEDVPEDAKTELEKILNQWHVGAIHIFDGQTVNYAETVKDALKHAGYDPRNYTYEIVSGIPGIRYPTAIVFNSEEKAEFIIPAEPSAARAFEGNWPTAAQNTDLLSASNEENDSSMPLYNYSDFARASRKAGLFGHGGIGITYPGGTFNWKTGAAAVGIFTVLVICLYSFVRSRKPGD